MTKAGIKTEDYREITDYWCRRLIWIQEEMYADIWREMINDLANPNRIHKSINDCLEYFYVALKQFDCNIMTLGYPKSTDTERILKLEHKGIEIRTGKPEWGAIPDKIYFVIMHGNIIQAY